MRSATPRAPTSPRCRSRARRSCARSAKPSSGRGSALQLARPESVAGAVAALAEGRALAGGTELVPLLRDGIVEAETLVDVREAVPRGISGRTIGAGTTLTELEASADVPRAL